MEFKSGKTALILEGGALRSQFTCGVLDVFMENDIYFPCICGVSAGSMCAISYLSRQIGRTSKITIDYSNDKRYISIRNLIKHKMIFNFDFLFGEITYELVPLDTDTLFNSKQKLVVFTTDCSTGKSVAHEMGKCDDILLACRASSSMPVLSKTVVLDGVEHLDGGIADPIPYKWAFENGYDKVVLVLTRDIDYRKKGQSKALEKVYKRTYKKYPELVNTLCNVPKHYNDMAEEIAELEKQGKLFVIRPHEPVKVKRTEKDVQKLRELYEIGRKVGEEMLAPMTEYLKL